MPLVARNGRKLVAQVIVLCGLRGSLLLPSACAVGLVSEEPAGPPLAEGPDASIHGSGSGQRDAAAPVTDAGAIDPPGKTPNGDASAASDASVGGTDGSSGPPAPSDAGSDAVSLDAASLDAAALDAGQQITLTIAVDPTSSQGTIGPGFVGLSYEKLRLQQGLFRGSNTALLALFNLLGPSVLRIGGASQDETVWLPTAPGATDAGSVGAGDAASAGDGASTQDGAAAPSYITPGEVDDLASFAQAAGWKVLYGLNMATSSPGGAQSEAAYVTNSLGSSLESFEIGNSPDLYSSIAVGTGSWSPGTFISEWSTFETAIAEVAPVASFAGPSAGGAVSVWAAPFAAAEASSLGLLTQHYYIGSGLASNATVARMLVPDPVLTADLTALRNAQAANPNAPPFRIDECNTYYGGGPASVMTSFASALWALDFMFANASNGSSGVNFHGDGDSSGYTPIADSSGSILGVRPMFYGLLLFTTAGTGTVLQTTVASSGINFSAYAIGGTGKTSVVLSNKDHAAIVHATVDVGIPVTTAGALTLSASSVEATSGVTFGGATVTSVGTFAPNAPEPLTVSGTTFEVDVPPASAVLVTVQ